VNTKYSMLLVEDDKTNLDLLASILPRKFPGVELFTAENGVKGLQAFQTHLPDLVITDINMPEMNGVLMIDEIRAIAPGTRIIFLTGDTGNRSLKDSVAKGFVIDHLVLKPVNFADLFAAIEQCMGERNFDCGAE